MWNAVVQAEKYSVVMVIWKIIPIFAAPFLGVKHK